MDIIPEPKTDPNSTPWAKTMTKHVKNANQSIENMQANIKNTNQTVGAQIALLQQQVSDLQARQSYFSEVLEPAGNPLGTTVNGATLPINGRLTFKLTTPRRVLVRVTADVICYVNATGNGISAWSTVSLSGLLVNSSSQDMWDGPSGGFELQASSSLLLSVPVAGTKSGNAESTIIAEHVYLNLPPDTYTLTGSIGFGFTGTGNGAVNSYHESFFVQVLD